MTTTTETIPAANERRSPSGRLRFAVAFPRGAHRGPGDRRWGPVRLRPAIRRARSAWRPDRLGRRLRPDARRRGRSWRASTGRFSSGQIVLSGPEGDEVITYEQIGRKLDADALVTEALAIGRSGSALDRVVADARTAFRGVSLAPRVTFDAEALVTKIGAIAAALEIAASRRSGRRGRHIPLPARHPGPSVARPIRPPRSRGSPSPWAISTPPPRSPRRCPRSRSSRT